MRTLLLLALSLPALAAETPAERLAALRAEVDGLAQEVSLDEEALRGRLRSLDSVRAELEVRIREEELALQQLRLEVERERAAAADGSDVDAVLEPAVRDGIAALRPVIADGLPFRIADRLAALDEIETGLVAGTLPAHKAAGRLWQMVEDELRLARENAIDRGVVTVGGDEVLADVARVGMVALYFRTPDGTLGAARRTEGGWAFVPFDDRAADEQVAALFDALDKQIRVGAFTLPDAFPEVR